MGYNDLVLLMPQQSSMYNGIHNVYSDMVDGFRELGVYPCVVEIRSRTLGDSKFTPEFDLQHVEIDEIDTYFEGDASVLTIDDHSLLRHIYRRRIRPWNTLIWAQYFFGSRFFFKEYRETGSESSLIPKVKHKASGLIPSTIYNYIARWYTETLRESNLFAQSLWTSLLLNRTYGLRCQGVIYLPVDSKWYNFPLNSKRERRVLLSVLVRIQTQFLCIL